MTDRIRTLLFYANSVPHWRRIVADTLVGGLRMTPENIPAWCRDHHHLRFLFAEEYRTLSYLVDWREAFCESPQLEVHLCNINNLFEYRAALRKLRDFPLSIILHSAAGDNLALLRRAAAAFQARRGILMICFGNEYSLMPDKIGFAHEVGAEYIVSQLPWKSAQWLYTDCPQSEVLSCPAALNPRLYRPTGKVRAIDIGFRGDLYEHQHALGDNERSEILGYFQRQSARLGLVADIQFRRYPREDWSGFLNRCKGIVGAESGTYYLEKDDRTREAVVRFIRQHQAAGFSEIYDRFFKSYTNPVSGKAISSRHFEPIGTKTCQILLEGHYNGLLKADEHYISVKKDFSNIEEAIRRFRDEGYRQAMVERAYEYALAEHTYGHRVEALIAAVSNRLGSC